ncbi:hypothetical protein ACQJ21_18070 [Klebsiella michiganensis]|uniref:hypothetical protein n=1 Tax=Klebsiella michiganensis TaxID=1134687 RepID=UPI003D02DC21
MNAKEIDGVFHCDCGFSWSRGKNGSHNCADGLREKVQQLAAENVGLKAIVDSVTDLSNEPQYHAEGMGCGLEDRGITDRYDAMWYGWDEDMERVYGEVIPCADELDFSATDRIVAGIKAEGAEACVRALVTSDDDDFSDAPNICAMVAYQLREGADK